MSTFLSIIWRIFYPILSLSLLSVFIFFSPVTFSILSPSFPILSLFFFCPFFRILKEHSSTSNQSLTDPPMVLHRPVVLSAQPKWVTHNLSSFFKISPSNLPPPEGVYLHLARHKYFATQTMFHSKHLLNINLNLKDGRTNKKRKREKEEGREEEKEGREERERKEGREGERKEGRERKEREKREKGRESYRDRPVINAITFKLRLSTIMCMKHCRH